MTRSSVDLPQPDGPMSDTNSPGRMSRSIPWRATVRPPSRVVNTLSRPRIRTTGWSGVAPARVVGHASTPGRPRSTRISATRMTRKNITPSTPATKIAAHSFSGPVA